jgi:hypothetical protein
MAGMVSGQAADLHRDTITVNPSLHLLFAVGFQLINAICRSQRVSNSTPALLPGVLMVKGHSLPFPSGDAFTPSSLSRKKKEKKKKTAKDY